jgi:hypothetical protein
VYSYITKMLVVLLVDAPTGTDKAVHVTNVESSEGKLNNAHYRWLGVFYVAKKISSQ